MKRFWSIVFFTVLLLSGLQAAPVVVWDNDSVNVGVVTEEDEEIECAFFFCNEGDETYEINRIEASCDTHVTSYWSPIPDSNYTGYVWVRMGVQGLKNGAFQKHIYLYSNTQTYRLVIYGTIDFPVKVLINPIE
ncbi:MAG: DUF1573 domain-containing protein [Paludibacteraceae bacterium]|nr:DUF1573 domain-containing protein [Paludibacteraceae bacterium]